MICSSGRTMTESWWISGGALSEVVPSYNYRSISIISHVPVLYSEGDNGLRHALKLENEAEEHLVSLSISLTVLSANALCLPEDRYVCTLRNGYNGTTGV
jgi:hypothetical protein